MMKECLGEEIYHKWESMRGVRRGLLKIKFRNKNFYTVVANKWTNSLNLGCLVENRLVFIFPYMIFDWLKESALLNLFLT